MTMRASSVKPQADFLLFPKRNKELFEHQPHYTVKAKAFPYPLRAIASRAQDRGMKASAT